jgi:hypothetical protein
MPPRYAPGFKLQIEAATTSDVSWLKGSEISNAPIGFTGSRRCDSPSSHPEATKLWLGWPLRHACLIARSNLSAGLLLFPIPSHCRRQLTFFGGLIAPLPLHRCRQQFAYQRELLLPCCQCSPGNTIKDIFLPCATVRL